jgi:hypothetical protein
MKLRQQQFLLKCHVVEISEIALPKPSVPPEIERTTWTRIVGEGEGEI